MKRTPRLFFSLILLLSILLFSSEGLAEGGLSQRSKKELLKEKRLEQKDRDRIKAAGIFSMSTWKHNYSFGKAEKKGIEISSVHYNTDGNIVEETTYNQNDGTIFSTTKYRYNQDGDLIEEVTMKGMPRRKQFTVTTQPGNKKEMVSYRQDGSVDRKGIYSYDGDNNLVESLGYLSGREIILERIIYLRSPVGNVIEQQNSISLFTYAYDDNGNMIEMIKYSRDFNNLDSAEYNVANRIKLEYDSLET